MRLCARLSFLLVLFGAVARADPPKQDESEPPTPGQLALRLALPAVGVVVPFSASRVETPGAMLAWPLQYALDDLLSPRVRVVLEPQVVYPSPETFPLRLRLGFRFVPRLHGVVDDDSRFFFGAGASFSSRIAVSGEIGWRIVRKWPLWTFFVALRGDYRFTGDARGEAAVMVGFMIM